MNTVFNYDVVVVGAGHAGCEAAAAAAGMGAKTCLITMDMNKIAQMSCNPAIGGIAKGQIVREIDALGGFTGLVTDRASIQFRMLNRSKGPAMWSPRAQCDRMRFIQEWRKILENTPNLNIWQDEVAELLTEQGHISGVRTVWGAQFNARSVVITAGTFLNGLMHIGRKKVQGGRCSEPASTFLTRSIESLGIESARMKTGTPVRIDARSVHFEEMENNPVKPTITAFPTPRPSGYCHNCRAGRATPIPRSTKFCAADCRIHRSTTARFKVSVRATARASKPSWSPSPTASSTRSSWNPKASIPTRCT